MSGGATKVCLNDILIPTDYDRDTVTVSYELRGDTHQGDVTLYNTGSEIKRDETVMAPRWPSNRLSNNTAKNQTLAWMLSSTGLSLDVVW